MKKSLILASLLLAGTNMVASDSIDFDYGMGTTKLDNSNGTIDSTGYSISLNRNTEKYILSSSFSKGNSESSKIILSGTEFSYNNDYTSLEIFGAYKVKLINNIFLAPYLAYNTSSWSDEPYTKISTGQKYSSLETSDTNLKTGIAVGINLNNDIDNYAYIAYTLDDDLLESKDYDHHTLNIGVKYKINTRYIMNCNYSQDLSNDEGISSSSGFVFGVGYIF